MKHGIVEPRLQQLAAGDAALARRIAARLEAAGHEAWLVGGCVRDLALGRTPHDIDLATDAPPQRIEECFERTAAVGAAFGTVLVFVEGREVQVTTFRSDGVYRDGRRPESVRFGSSLEEDAARRDFTCNALFLSPTTEELRDPTGGLADLRDGLLRCVGDPAQRFREDGLRILRMARFAAGLDLQVEDPTLRAARSERGSLRGVSAERVLHEFERMASGPAPGRAVGLLAETGALASCFPSDATHPERVEALGPSPGLVRFLCSLFEDPGAGAGRSRERRAARRALFGRLRLSREVSRTCGEVWELARELREVRVHAVELSRARRLRLLRSPHFEDAVAILRAAPGAPDALLDALQREAAELKPEELRPRLLLGAADLRAAGVPRGPEFGQLLERLEEEQLEGNVASREEALRWLASARRESSGEETG